MLYQILRGQASPTEIVALIVALVLGITVHEFSHALMATRLGDPLPERQGRLSLAPTAHLDVMGSLMFLIGGFGWGKPVQYNPFNLRAGPRTGPALVALAGPVSNVVLAALFAIPIRLMPLILGTSMRELLFSTGPERIVLELALGIVTYNLVLAIFNLIPVFPLDGFSVLLGVLPAEFAAQYEQTQQYGFFILLLLLLAMNYVPLLSTILYGPVGEITHLLTGL